MSQGACTGVVWGKFCFNLILHLTVCHSSGSSAESQLCVMLLPQPWAGRGNPRTVRVGKDMCRPSVRPCAKAGGTKKHREGLDLLGKETPTSLGVMFGLRAAMNAWAIRIYLQQQQ